jgi:deoxyribodipyrimidine photo-lyase
MLNPWYLVDCLVFVGKMAPDVQLELSHNRYMREKINIVWLKKDLRSLDHAPLFAAQYSHYKTLVLYIFEPLVINNYDFDLRHYQFTYQSLLDLQTKMPIQIFYGEASSVFQTLNQDYEIQNVFSHQETGNLATYERDLLMKILFQKMNIKWIEFATNAVMRGKKDRKGWDYNWQKVMQGKQIENDLTRMHFVTFTKHSPLSEEFQASLLEHEWPAGEEKAHQALEVFINERIENYFAFLSYPEKSRYYTSQLSPYLTYGNLSVRQVYQKVMAQRGEVKNKRSLDQFLSRLKWHCHFIQKLESEPRLEYENLNAAFDNIRQKKNKHYIKAWKEGMTGYPLIDAAMRCVKETGLLNFRLRATVVSFFTHHLWQPWHEGARILARYFLDYEPGIHFSQFQMQAGTMGIHTLRIYNPVKQSLEKDADATFIKRWVPELSHLPLEFIHRPWLMSAMDEMLFNFKLGVDYPRPIVEHEVAAKVAKEKLWATKNSESSKKEATKILKTHVRAKRKNYVKKHTYSK